MTSYAKFWNSEELNETYIFEKPTTRAIKTIFIDFGQVFQKLWLYKCSLTTFWHRLLPNMVIPRDAGQTFATSMFKILFSIKRRT